MQNQVHTTTVPFCAASQRGAGADGQAGGNGNGAERKSIVKCWVQHVVQELLMYPAAARSGAAAARQAGSDGAGAVRKSIPCVLCIR